jgi:hypothetical protein
VINPSQAIRSAKDWLVTDWRRTSGVMKGLAAAAAFIALGMVVSNIGYLLTPGRPNTMKYWGGPVEHNPDIRVIYWGPKWLGGNFNFVKAAVARFFKLLPGSNYQNVTAQYWDKTGKVGLDPRLVATYIDSNAPSGRITTTQVAAEVKRIALLKGWPAGVNQQYVVMGEPGANTDDAANPDCGYHDWSSQAGLTYIYDFIPYEGDCIGGANGLQAVTTNTKVALRHESAEAMADPLRNAWRTYQGDALADVCNSGKGPTNPSAMVLEPAKLWDITRHSCTMQLSRPVDEKLTVLPVSSHTRSVYNIDVKVEFPVFIPGDAATVILHGVGYDMRHARISTTRGCAEKSALDGRRGFRYQFVCHSRRINIAARVRTVPPDFPPVARDAFLNVSLDRNGVQAIGLTQPPRSCTESMVWQPKYASSSLAAILRQPVKCL